MARFIPLVHIPSTDVDIILENEEFSLFDFGIPGKVIHTPGHSSGSVSVLLETGDVFVGDLAMNGFPLRLSPGLPIFAEDLQEVKDSWKLLLDKGARMVYPAHGRSFSAEIIRKIIIKKENKYGKHD
jgi:glyoxylase-like metal-dependent hydrolase (beta-lactamase superfamily II)